MSQFSCGSEFVVCDVGTCVSAESWIAVAGPTADPSRADGRFARRAALCAACQWLLILGCFPSAARAT